MRSPLSGVVMGICVAISLVLAARADAEPASFEGVGRAPISAGDRVRARDRALDEAFQRAVEAAIAALLGPDVLARRAGDLRLKILPRARSYASSYRVVEEGELEPGVFVVKVSAEISVDRLARELADKAARPTTLLALSTRVGLCIAADQPTPRLAVALRTMLASRGAEVVAGTACSDDEIARLGAASGLRATLVAEVVPAASSPIRGTALVGRDVKLTLRLVEPGGRRSAELHAETSGYGATSVDATDDAAQLAASEALPGIEAALGSLLPRAGVQGIVIARVVGVRRFAQLAMVRSALERLPGVEGAEPRLFSPGTPALIELGVRTAQAPRALLDGLARAASAYPLRAREADGALVIEVLDALDPAAPPGAPQ